MTKVPSFQQKDEEDKSRSESGESPDEEENVSDTSSGTSDKGETPQPQDKSDGYNYSQKA